MRPLVVTSKKDCRGKQIFVTGFMRSFLLHIITWLGILSISLILFVAGNDSPGRNQTMDKIIYLHLAFTVALLAGLFYLVSYVLIPRLLYRKKIWIFIPACLLLGLGFMWSMNYFMSQLRNPMAQSGMRPLPPANGQGMRGFRPPPPMDSSFAPGPPPDSALAEGPAPSRNPNPRPSLPYSLTVLPFLIMLTSAIAHRYVTDSNKKEKDIRDQQLATLTSELQFLKLQISPHFLFNVMNNLTYLARKNSALLEPSLQKLSSLLRYMIYDTNAGTVALETEIKYLEDYIGLQKLRYQEIRVDTYFQNDDEEAVIAPMLLIPFVENAFKHAGSFVDQERFIRIELVAKDGRLQFRISNKYSRSAIEQKDAASGIGLANVRKRLQLIYPGKHYLSIQTADETFAVILQINLTEQ